MATLEAVTETTWDADVFRDGHWARIETFHQFAAIPAYFAPGTDWTRMAEARVHVAMVILNLADGPGQSYAGDVGAQVAVLQRAGIELAGYIDTGHATRPMPAVIADASRYREWYGAESVFLDQAHVSAPVVDSYYRPVYQRLKEGSPNRRVILNAGATMPERVMTAADVLVDFEGDYDAYVVWSQPPWKSRYHPDRFWHIVHGVPGREDLDRVMELSRIRRTGWLYVTDQVAESSSGDRYLYDRLPEPDHWRHFQRHLWP